MLLWAAIASAAPLSACARTFRSEDLIDAAHAAEGRFAEQDVDGFTAARAEVELRLVCTSDPLSPSDVVTIHRVLALGAFFAGDDARARSAVAAMLTVSPSAAFPVELVPEGSKLALMVDEMSGKPHPDGPAVTALSDGWIEVNGAFSPHVMVDVVATLQRFDNQGVVVESRLWWPSDSLGDWAGTGTEATVSEAAQKSAATRKEKAPKLAPERPIKSKVEPVATAGVKQSAADLQIKHDKAVARHIALLSATGLTAVATGVVYALAAGAHDQALDPEVPLQQAQVYRDQANGLSYAWIGTSVLTGGLLATVAFTW